MERNGASTCREPEQWHVTFDRVGDPSPPITLSTRTRPSDGRTYRCSSALPCASASPDWHGLRRPRSLQPETAVKRFRQDQLNVRAGDSGIGFRNDPRFSSNRWITSDSASCEDGMESGKMASFIIRDRLTRLYPNPAKRLAPDLLPAADLPQRWRDGATDRRDIHVRNEWRPNTDPHAGNRRETPADERSLVSVDRWIDPSKERLVWGSHMSTRRGCFALHESRLRS